MKKLFILIIAAMVAAGVSAADGNAGEKKELRANFRHKIGLGVGLGVLTGRSTTDLTRYSFPSSSNTPLGMTSGMDYCLMVNDNWGIGVDASGTFIYGDCEYPESNQDRYHYYSNDNQRMWDVAGLTVGPVYRIIKGPWAVMLFEKLMLTLKRSSMNIINLGIKPVQLRPKWRQPSLMIKKAG